MFLLYTKLHGTLICSHVLIYKNNHRINFPKTQHLSFNASSYVRLDNKQTVIYYYLALIQSDFRRKHFIHIIFYVQFIVNLYVVYLCIIIVKVDRVYESRLSCLLSTNSVPRVHPRLLRNNYFHLVIFILIIIISLHIIS